jgi:hypothetical protein
MDGQPAWAVVVVGAAALWAPALVGSRQAAAKVASKGATKGHRRTLCMAVSRLKKGLGRGGGAGVYTASSRACHEGAKPRV